jgi:hypothetical protein
MDKLLHENIKRNLAAFKEIFAMPKTEDFKMGLDEKLIIDGVGELAAIRCLELKKHIEGMIVKNNDDRFHRELAEKTLALNEAIAKSGAFAISHSVSSIRFMTQEIKTISIYEVNDAKNRMGVNRYE